MQTPQVVLCYTILFLVHHRPIWVVLTCSYTCPTVLVWFLVQENQLTNRVILIIVNFLMPGNWTRATEKRLWACWEGTSRGHWWCIYWGAPEAFRDHYRRLLHKPQGAFLSLFMVQNVESTSCTCSYTFIIQLWHVCTFDSRQVTTPDDLLLACVCRLL